MKIFSLLAAVVWGDEASDKAKDAKLHGERFVNPSDHAVVFGAPNSGSCTDSTSGLMTTVSSEHNYQNNARCHMEYTCERGHVAFVKYNRFEVEPHGACAFDYVKLSWKDTDTDAVTSVTKCERLNSQSDPALFDWRHTFSNHVVVDFYTDSSYTEWGFELEINCVDESTIDICTFANCHAEATCVVDPNDAGEYTCECRPFYSGDGVNDCSFDLGCNQCDGCPDGVQVVEPLGAKLLCKDNKAYIKVNKETNFAKVDARRLNGETSGWLCAASHYTMEKSYDKAGTTRFSAYRVVFSGDSASIDTSDFTFSETDSITLDNGDQVTNQIKAGNAGDCYAWANCDDTKKGSFSIDLTGTKVGIDMDPDFQWTTSGWPDYMQLADYAKNNQKVSRASGTCPKSLRKSWGWAWSRSTSRPRPSLWWCE